MGSDSECTPVDRVRLVLAEERQRKIDPRTARFVSAAIREIFAGLEPLTEAEESVVCLAAIGWEDKEVAFDLRIAESTVRSVWAKVLRKAGTNSKRLLLGRLIAQIATSTNLDTPPTGRRGSTAFVWPVAPTIRRARSRTTATWSESRCCRRARDRASQDFDPKVYLMSVS